MKEGNDMKLKGKKTKLSHVIYLPKIEDEGFLSFAEEKKHLPFRIKRFYYIYDVIKNTKRGFHAHKKTKQVLFCVRGKVKVILDNGKEREEIKLDEPHKGLYLDKLIWHEMHDFTDDTVILVAASETFNEADYIRDYGAFLDTVNNRFFSKYFRFDIPFLRLTFLNNK